MKRPLCKTPPLGDTAQAPGRTLHSYHLGLLPILNRLLTRLRLEPILRDYLPPEDRRSRIAPAQGLVILLKNLLLSREPSRACPSGPLAAILQRWVRGLAGDHGVPLRMP